MSRSWSPPEAIEPHPERFVVYADGSVCRDADVTLSEEQYRRMRQGYTCCRCYGTVDTAFPEACGFPGCDGYPDGFPMRARQLEVMDAEFDGHKWLGPSRQTVARHENSMDDFRRKTGVWIPGRP